MRTVSIGQKIKLCKHCGCFTAWNQQGNKEKDNKYQQRKEQKSKTSEAILDLPCTHKQNKYYVILAKLIT